MQRSFGLQIFDLETIESVFEQELTFEEAKKVVGGSGNKDKDKDKDKDKEPKDPKDCGGCKTINIDSTLPIVTAADLI